MNDLAVGYAAIAAAAVGLFLATARAATTHRTRILDGAALGIVACLFVYIRWVWYDPRLAAWLPLSSLIVVGNWLPLFAAALAGVVWGRLRHAPARRWATTSALGLCAILAAVFPLLGAAPKCGDHWDALGTCLQTTHNTCSPACAATLLSKHGIAATEREMAELCLTRKGTSWQGLYRGLKLKTAGTRWDVQIHYGSADELTARYGGPMIVSVGLDSSAPAQSEFTREFGWIPGVNHSVILERVRPTGMVIADPTQEMTREHWDRELLRTLWRGHAMRLVPRER